MARNTTVTIIAKILPLFVGVLALPYLIENLGEANFGILAIVWLVISYFSMFDLGIGRAVVREISELIGAQKYNQIPVAAWTGIMFIFGMGIVAGVILFIAGDLILDAAFKTHNQVASQALFYTSFAVPFIVGTTGFRALLMAEQKFFVISVIQSINSLFNYLLPVLLIYFFSTSFIQIVIALLLLKVTAFLGFCIAGLLSEPSLQQRIYFSKEYLVKMFQFGKWVTISNVIGPLLSQLDRYFIAFFISSGAVTFYTTPLEVLSKLMMLPMAFITVLFPAFSTLSTQPFQRREQLFIESSKGIMLLLFPVLLVVSTFAGFGLNLWVGPEFAEKSQLVAQLFCIVFFLRGTSYIPATYLPGINKPYLPAKFHVIELIVAIPGFYLAANTGNLLVVALISLGITVLDTSLLFWASYKNVHQKGRFISQLVFPLLVGAVLLLDILLIKEEYVRIGVFIVVLVSFTVSYREYISKTTNKLFRLIRGD